MPPQPRGLARRGRRALRRNAGDGSGPRRPGQQECERDIPELPLLRAKPALKIVALLLGEDCVSPAEAARQAPMTDRAARRLFDRLLALGAAREFSGRPTFRLYGL